MKQNIISSFAVVRRLWKTARSSGLSQTVRTGELNRTEKRPSGRLSRFPRTGDLGRGLDHPVRSRGRHPWRAWRPNGTRHVGRGAQPPCWSRRGREGERRREALGKQGREEEEAMDGERGPPEMRTSAGSPALERVPRTGPPWPGARSPPACPRVLRLQARGGGELGRGGADAGTAGAGSAKIRRRIPHRASDSPPSEMARPAKQRPEKKPRRGARGRAALGSSSGALGMSRLGRVGELEAGPPPRAPPARRRGQGGRADTGSRSRRWMGREANRGIKRG
jgi:hypothetical protein